MQMSHDEHENSELQKLGIRQVNVARELSPQALLSALYGQKPEVIAESFRGASFIGVSLCDERGRLRVLVQDLAEAVLRIADVEYESGMRSDGWRDQTRTEMRDKAIRALETGLERARHLRKRTQHLETEGYDERFHHLLRASLRAGMIGDSLGAAIEFKSLSEIRSIFPRGVDRILPAYKVRGAITDDSQMMFFTLEGLLQSEGKTLNDKVLAVHHALLRWLETQDERAPINGGSEGLVRNPLLRHRRAPGMTCLSSLQGTGRLGQRARNDSKGCGTIMRVAPVAFVSEAADIRELACQTSALTHGHATGAWAAAFWAELIRRVCESATGTNIAIDPIIADLVADYSRIAEAAEVVAAVRQAMSDNGSQPEDMERLGGGWTAETALAIALRACRTARDLEQGLVAAVTHGGDSDSTGAIAGNLLGVMFPDQVFRHRWHDEVEGAEILDALLPPISP